MQSIITKYIGPGNVRGSRLSVRATGGCSLMLHWRDELNNEENHREGAMALARKYGWHGTWTAGAYNDKGATIWVCSTAAFPSDSFTIAKVQP
jgi:hypothetical protein